MKLLISSDWHGDHVTHGVSRFAEISRAVHESVDRAIEEQVDVYAFLGDLCNPDSGSAVFRTTRLAIEVATRLRASGIKFLAISGNHDVIEDGSGETTLTPLSGLVDEDGMITVCEQPALLMLDDVFVAAFPFTASAHAYDPVAKWTEFQQKIVQLTEHWKCEKKVVVLAHMTEIEGVEPGEETTEMSRGRGVPLPADLMINADLVANGHFHRQQLHGHVWIPGALARLTFGEERHPPSYLLASV